MGALPGPAGEESQQPAERRLICRGMAEEKEARVTRVMTGGFGVGRQDGGAGGERGGGERQGEGRDSGDDARFRRENVQSGSRSSSTGGESCISNSFGRVLRQHHRAASIMLWCGIVLLLLPPTGGQDDGVFVPIFEWKAQELYFCGKYRENSLECECFLYNENLAEPCSTERPRDPDFKVAEGRRSSCVQQPQSTYSCPVGTACECDNECIPLETEFGTEFPASCMTMIGSLEDTWTKIATIFKHNPGLGIPPQSPADNPFLGSFFRATINASYGSFDIFSTSLVCELTPDAEGLVSECVVEPSMWLNATQRTYMPDMVRYRRYTEDVVTQLTIVGTFANVSAAMEDLQYRPDIDSNSMRLRSRLFSSKSAKERPFEIMTMDLEWLRSGDPLAADAPFVALEGGRLEQLIYSVDINDRPGIIKPLDSYELPAYCDGHNPNPACHFGQVYSYEDTDTNVEVKGVLIYDIDVYEKCLFTNPECAKIDVTVQSAMGAIGLNTRTGLSSYESSRSSQGFTSILSAANTAVRVINYRVEETQLMGTSSKTYNYNTQHNNLAETITVTVSDQGFSGFVGVSEVNIITIPVTIIATNDAPIITVIPIEYDFTEEVQDKIEGISVTDVDVDEKIESSLSQLTWTNGAANMTYLNTMRLTASVNFGILKMQYTRNLRIVRTDEIAMVSFKRFRFGHDLCRLQSILDGTNAAPISAAFAKLGLSSFRFTEVCLLQNLGTSACMTGSETGCICLLDNDCKSTSATYVMYMDTTKRWETWIKVIEEAVMQTDKTCGGAPIYPAPNNFTTGLKCETDQDCDATNLETCTPGVDCFCCANMSHVCSVDIDCNEFDAQSSCGCTPTPQPVVGGVAAPGACGPYCRDSRLTKDCITDLVITPADQLKYFGRPCTFAAPFPDNGPGFTVPSVRTCRHAAYMQLGASTGRAQDLVSRQSATGGSRLISFIGGIVDVNRAVADFYYLTNKDYNRLYRPPVEERDFDFQLDADSLDALVLILSDLGNSGGSDYNPQTAFLSTPIRVRAVNDKPVVHGPATASVTEDKPFYFTSQALSNPGELINGFRVSDPDYKDYLFEEKIFSLNMSANYGRLFLNERYISAEDAGIEYRIWPGEIRQKRVGLHHDQGPKYGGGCETNLQCTDTVKIDDTGRYVIQSLDKPYGFFSGILYGTVYGIDKTGKVQGCGMCAEDVGNKFLSIRGTMAAINKAIERVTYLPDPNFNSRVGGLDTIVVEVTDNGATGNDGTSVPLTDSFEVSVNVLPINDKPLIGRRVKQGRTLSHFTPGKADEEITDNAVLPVNKTTDEFCLGIPPAGEEYWDVCGPGKRQFIDIDEDTIFTISPDVLWIDDVDSDEAERAPKRYCCPPAGPEGCECGQLCMCGATPCGCREPQVCTGQAGYISVIMTTLRGTLSFFPPPGRTIFRQSQLEFMTNSSGGSEVPCPVQTDCMRGVKRLSIRATKASIQKGLEEMFLSYVGDANYYGRDRIDVFVSDNTNTDFCYNASLSATETINVRVIAINDAPTVSHPSQPMSFTGTRCTADYMKNKANIEGINSECSGKDYTGASDVPPKPYSPTSSSVNFSDPDLSDTTYGNLSVIFTVGNNVMMHGNAGQFFLPKLRYPEFDSKAWYETFINSDGLNSMAMTGTLEDVNWLMQQIRFDTTNNFKGYLVMRATVNDLGNYGECSGGHQCGDGSACADHNTAERHLPTLPQITSFVLDADIGTVTRCQATSCKACNDLPGCGWCPGACTQDGGKCMIGSESPQFEACPVDILGKGWRQCTRESSSYLTLGIGVAGGVGFIALVVFVTLRWAQRRHGSIIRYARKKRSDLNRAGQQLKILPPETARYSQFFLLMGVTAAVAVCSQIFFAPEPKCVWRQEHFLDRATSVYLTVDGCTVRFVPASSKKGVESTISSIKMNFAYQHDAKINLDAQTCGKNNTFMLQNTLGDPTKYRDFYCNIEVVVPDRFLVPHFTINAVGENTTFVRAGPMDKDAPNFGLNFGPNILSFTGNRLQAHIQNVTGKSLVYNVRHGSLHAYDVSMSVGGNFTSTDADMIVSTSTRTTAKFWQKDGNKVCFTAANGSMYVDDSCKLVCEYPSVNQTRRDERAQHGEMDYFEEGAHRHERAQEHPNPRESLPLLGPNGGVIYTFDDVGSSGNGIKTGNSDSSTAAVHSTLGLFARPVGTPRRQSVTLAAPAWDGSLPTWECFGDPLTDDSWNCTIYDPVAALEADRCPLGTKYEFRSQVPVVDGCTNLQYCLYEESSLCLCKPKCDMAGLTPPGKCNDMGQCCQTICQGYSTADLFPDDNQPRCGSVIDPIGMPWCDGALDQQFIFTSESGQIDLTVLRNPNQAKVHSYQGSKTFSLDSTGNSKFENGSSLELPFDFDVADKKILDIKFHAAARFFPAEDWFAFKMTGPGAVPVEQGTFLWISTVLYLVVEPWLLQVLSLGTANPTKDSVKLRFIPGFCPAYIDEQSLMFNQRLIKMRRLIKDTLELFSGSGDITTKRPIPSRSAIAFLPKEGEARVFVLDAQGQVAVNKVLPSDYPLIGVMLYISTIVPLVVTAALLAGLWFSARNYLSRFREKRYVQEHTSTVLNRAFTITTEEVEEQGWEHDKDKIDAMRARTSFFFLFDDWLGLADTSRSLWIDSYVTFIQVSFVFLPAGFAYLASILVHDIYIKSQCESRPDICSCLSETHPLSWVAQAIQYVIYVYCGIAIAELELHILDISHNRFRRIFRVVFYMALFEMWWIALYAILVIVLWINLGVLMRPIWLIPYSIAIFGTGVAVITYYNMLNKFEMRVRKAVSARLQKYKTSLGRAMPTHVVNVLFTRSIDRALAENGLSFPRIISKVLQFTTVLLGMYAFLFIGFTAFTQKTDRIAGGVNSAICFTVAAVAWYWARGTTQESDIRDEVTVVEKRIMISLRKMFDIVTEQVDLARRMFLKMRHGYDGGSMGETLSTVSDMEFQKDVSDKASERSSLLGGTGRKM